MGPWKHKRYIFVDQFYLKNVKQLRFDVFLHFYAETLVLPEVDGTRKKLRTSSLVRVHGDP